MSPDVSRLFEGAREVCLSRGETLFLTDAPVAEIHRVHSGEMRLIRHTRQGMALTLNRAREGAILAEASAFSDRYHCDAVAFTEARVEAISKPRFLSRLAADPGLAIAWAAALARGVQSARLRSEIRSLTRVSERIDAWMDAGGELPRKGHLQDLASELGVTREALYRELAHRRKAYAATER